MAAASHPQHGRDFPVAAWGADQGGAEIGRGAGDVPYQRSGGGRSVQLSPLSSFKVANTMGSIFE